MFGLAGLRHRVGLARHVLFQGIRNQRIRNQSDCPRACLGLTWDKSRVCLGPASGAFAIRLERHRGWQEACTLLVVRALVLREVGHLDQPLLAGRVALDERVVVQVLQQRVDVAVVAGQQLDLDALGAILEAPGTISQAPQADEQQPAERVDLGQLLVEEERRLDVACARHDQSSHSVAAIMSATRTRASHARQVRHTPVPPQVHADFRGDGLWQRDWSRSMSRRRAGEKRRICADWGVVWRLTATPPGAAHRAAYRARHCACGRSRSRAGHDG
ncbi:hypothetical protein GALL_344320 [mine drainage metagenome]|uniref:Uncharacterized protein n=1 Tax=mine drainage metagenome TaxID=410659 RepID=A0A1J5QKF4_9ZZZZ